MIGTLVAATAGQTAGRYFLKMLFSTGFVAVSALVNREGPALALLVIFSGITGPAIRIMSFRTNGIYDRLIATPAPKPLLVLGYIGIWSAAVFFALLPAIGISMVLLGPVILLPACLGLVLAACIGTICGLAAKTLGDAHFFAVLAAVPLMIGAVLPGPQSLILPYSSIAAASVTLPSFVSQAGILVLVLIILGGAATRM